MRYESPSYRQHYKPRTAEDGIDNSETRVPCRRRTKWIRVQLWSTLDLESISSSCFRDDHASLTLDAIRGPRRSVDWYPGFQRTSSKRLPCAEDTNEVLERC